MCGFIVPMSPVIKICNDIQSNEQTGTLQGIYNRKVTNFLTNDILSSKYDSFSDGTEWYIIYPLLELVTGKGAIV